MGRTGLTARQTQAAMRGLPAQISDVVVSIQGGQSPMQVLLQQGAQVRDMFGGLGPALRAVGGYALSLIHPVNGLAAAAGTLGFAFYDAEKKAAAFSKAIFAGNGAAGMTGSALAQVAKQAASVSGSLASANRAAIALAASGKVGAGQLQSLTETTSAIAQFTGRDIEDVAKSLSELGDDATRAAARVSEQYRLLSYEQYQAIKAIDEQGDHQQAVDQLNEDLHRNAQERLKQYRESLSGVEQGWDAVKTAIGNAYAAIRADLFPTLNEQIQTLQRTLDQRQNAPFLSNALRGALTGAATGLPGVAATGALFQSFRDQFSSTEALKEQNSLLLVRKDLSEQNAKSEAELGEADQQLIAIEKELGDQLDDVSPAAKRAKAIDELTKRYVAGYRAAEKMISAGKLSALPDWLKGVNIVGDSVSGGTFDKLVAGINQRFKDPKAARSSQFRDDAATQYLLRLREQQGALEQQLGTSEKLSASQREMAKWEQQIADLKVKAVLTADQKSLLAREAEVRAQLQKNVALEAEARKKEEIARIDAYRANLEGRLRSVQQGYELQIAGLGAGDEERRRIQDRLKLEQEYQSQSAKLQEQRNRGETNGGISQSQYEKELFALDDYHRKALAKQNDYFHQVDEAQKDWSLGARSAFKAYLESTRDVAGQTKNLFTSAFSSMEDAVVSFAMTGKLSFSDFAKSVLADMARIATRQAATGIFSGLAGSVLGSAVSGFFGGGAGGTSASDYTGSAFTSWVAGQRASGGTVAPNSLYEVNERGPELLSQGGRTYLMTGAEGGSVVPLGAGRASVAAAGGGSMSISIYAPVTLQSQDQEAGAIDQAALQRGLESRFRAVAVEEIGKATRAGGQIWRSINGR
ncbi:phage tail tape measure protein [Pseudomonas aeruginosa]|uniref:phage tail tape measure protein n=1 Tax=Pseudomonas aeruginosa TaxID=287 RepID=UPI000F543C42|nr:phage tail tape measure protein [Pseudomonas aeruginosa]RPU22538.1 phage tail tape measure protein [Pseudomonas aeruginosa]RPU29180.1 phage tail tape measure protein [Pseudomonas aeruginosa]UJG16014.1 phage tail tape measure protein [Pseudomonas aeruginosa]UJG21718.1 phage tail tape measure protein [Pseudomonas aeruginosa]UJG27415.1 phage tail tape measure protein [Pseudomonas aeruginosa]